MTTAAAAAIVCGMLCGGALMLIVRELTPSHPRLGDALSTIDSGDPFAALTRTTPPSAPKGRERVGAWLERHQAQIPLLRIPRRDLDLIGQTPREYLTAKGLCAAIGFALPNVIGVFASLIGIGLPFVLPFAASLVLAVVFWLLPDADVAARAARAREAFATAAVSYLRLVAIQRLGSSGVVTSMEESARVSDAWMFQRIREALAAARYSGLTAWDAIEQLSTQLDVSELKEIADITRQSESGAAINANLMARAASMRDRMLSREHTAAARAVTGMVAPTSLLFGLFMVTVLYPAVMKIIGGA